MPTPVVVIAISDPPPRARTCGMTALVTRKTPVRLTFSDSCFHRLLGRDVARHRQRPASRCRDAIGDGVDRAGHLALLLGARGHRDRRTFARQRLGDRRPYAAAG